MPEHEEIKLPEVWYDNSKLTDYRDNGDRHFFFKHINHWVPPGSGIAADWGTAWHFATEPLWEVMCGKAEDDALQAGLDCLGLAAQRFIDTWDRLQPEFPVARVLDDPEMEMKLFDKSPLLAFVSGQINGSKRSMSMLEAYVRSHASWFTRFELVGIEKPFVVPVFPDNDDIAFVGLIDRIIRLEGKYLAPVDLKSTGNFNYSVNDGIKSMYFKQFEVNSQARGYVYGLSLLYPDEDVDRAYIDASLRHRNKSQAREDIHKIWPLPYNKDQITEWLYDARLTIERIEDQKRLQAEGKPCWPRGCGGGCMKYGTCAYFDLCLTAQRPQDCQQPANMTVRPWNPIKLHLEEVMGL